MYKIEKGKTINIEVDAICRRECMLLDPCKYYIELTPEYYLNRYYMKAEVLDEIEEEKNSMLGINNKPTIERTYDIEVIMTKIHIGSIAMFYYDKNSDNKHKDYGYIPYYSIEIKSTCGRIDVIEFWDKKDARWFMDVMKEWRYNLTGNKRVQYDGC